MTFFEKLEKSQKEKNSLVCVGLDIDLEKVPKFVLKESDPVFFFNKAIIDATHEFTCAYKPNIPFYEALGGDGLDALKRSIEYIHNTYDMPVVMDCKRNDIGNTAKVYAKTILDYYGADGMTVNPYMGSDAIQPFLEYADKGIFILARTSNPGGADFQNLVSDGKPLYVHVIEKCLEWDNNGNVGFVVGATNPNELREIRELAPQATFVIPGIGAQGGDTEKTIKYGLRADGLGAVINSSRGIIYASEGEDFAEKAGEEAKKLRDEINRYR